MASAATGLSLIARIIRPQGELSSRSDISTTRSRTTENSTTKQVPTNMLDATRMSAWKNCASAMNQSDCCSATSCGTGQRPILMMFFTPRSSQSSFIMIAMMIWLIPRVAIAR